MFFWRNDKRFLNRARRRVRSPLGAVFSEFALLAPILVLMISAMIEFAGFWDARIMANHTAWTVGRIAMVRGPEFEIIKTDTAEIDSKRRKLDSDDVVLSKVIKPLGRFVPGLKNIGNRGQIATLFLMSTCQMGYFGGAPSDQLAKFIAKTFVEPLRDWLKKGFDAKISGLVKELVKKEVGRQFDKMPFDFLSPIVSRVIKEVLDPVVDRLFKPIDEFIGKKLPGWIAKRLEFLDKLLLSDGTAARRARQLIGAAIRMGKTPDVVTVSYVKEKKAGAKMDAWYGNKNDPKQARRLAFPKTFAGDAKSNGYRADGYTGWPPNNQVLPMYTVKISWPYSTGWLFPVVSGMRNGSEGTVRATGYSYVLPSINLEPEHLDSVNPVKFAEGSFVSKIAEALNGLTADLNDFMNLSLYAMKYRLVREPVGIDDWNANCRTDKHLLPIARWYGIKHKKRTGGRGWVYDPDSAKSKPSYYESWKRITGYTGFYETLVDVRARIANHLDRLWFCWPEGSPVRQRYNRGHYSSVNAYEQLSLQQSNFPFFSSKGRAYAIPTFSARHSRAIRLTGIMNIDSYLMFYYGDGKVDAFKTEDKAAITKSGLVKKNADTFFKWLNVFAEELEDNINGAGDVGAALVPKDEDKVDLNNVEAVRAWAKKKLEYVKTESVKVYREIDRRIDPLNKAYDAVTSRSKQNVIQRQKLIEDVQRRICKIADEIVEFDSMPDGDVQVILRELLRRQGPLAFDPLGSSDGLPSLKAAIDDFHAKIEELWQLEKQYAGILGAKSATDQQHMKLDDYDPDETQKGKDLPRAPYGKSDYSSGSDDDELGDHFKFIKGSGWSPVK